jgi:hypothetical protein
MFCRFLKLKSKSHLKVKNGPQFTHPQMFERLAPFKRKEKQVDKEKEKKTEEAEMAKRMIDYHTEKLFFRSLECGLFTSFGVAMMGSWSSLPEKLMCTMIVYKFGMAVHHASVRRACDKYIISPPGEEKDALYSKLVSRHFFFS